jgi:hypothetical protein
MASTWYLKQGQCELGPLSVGQLRWLAQRGRLRRRDLLRPDNASQWQRLADIEELAGIWDGQTSGEAAQSHRSAKHQRPRWREPDAEVASSRSTGDRHSTGSGKAPPRQRRRVDSDRVTPATTRSRDDVYARHRLREWRTRRSKSGSCWSLAGLILVGLLSASAGAWMMSRVFRAHVGDGKSVDADHQRAAVVAESTAEDDRHNETEKQFDVPSDLELRLGRIAVWNAVGQQVTNPSGSTRVEVTDVWSEPAGASAKSGSFKLLFQIRLTNLDNDKARQYESWNLRQHQGTLLLDQFNRSCPMISLSEDRRVERKSRATCPPGGSITDVLAFYVPDNYGDVLRVILPLAVSGDAGYVGFSVQRDQIDIRPPMKIDRHTPMHPPLLRTGRDPQGSHQLTHE